MEVDIRKYDLINQTMTEDQVNKNLLTLKVSGEDHVTTESFRRAASPVKVRSDLCLQVPGVAENRPSVLRGDHLKVSMSGDKSEPITVYKGYVHRVELESVKLGFAKKYGKGGRTGLALKVLKGR